MARKSKTKAETQEDVTDAVQSRTAQDATADTLSEYRSRCGGALRTHREKQGLSVQTVASRLRLSVKQIEALEADNFEALPEATIARGFIRNYAKLLEINVEPLLDAYNVLVPSKSPHSFTVQPALYANSRQYKESEIKRWIPFLAAALLALGVWLLYQSYIQKPSPVAPTASQLPAPEPLPQAALPAGERQADAQIATTEIALPPATPLVADTTIATPPAAVDAPVAVPEPATTPATVAKLSRLEFYAMQETWVSVVDASGKEIYNKTLFAGNREMVEAVPPLNVVVGNANGTSLSINGEETNLGPHTKVNVARIKVE
jgi:cytoskeleton protein RodZ